MNLGDGLKLETEVLDGKPRLILSASDKSKSAMKMGNKARAPKQALKIRHNGHLVRSPQNACVKQENVTKPRSESSLSMTKGEKLHVAQHSSCAAATKHHSLIFQRDSTNRYPDLENSAVITQSKQKPQNLCVSAEDLRSFVCLTQEQLRQILMTVKEGSRSTLDTHNKKQEEKAVNEASEENIALLQKACEIVPDETSSDLSRKQEAAYLHPGQKVTIDSWKPADMFSTLGEREGEKALLEFRKTQWKKELDEQVALKKKMKETAAGEDDYLWEKPGSNKIHEEKVETAAPQKADEPGRWTMPSDSSKNHLNSNAQHNLLGLEIKQPESLCLSPDPKEPTAFIQPFSQVALGNLMPLKVGNAEKAAKNSALEHSPKVSFLRSMTALLDPAQIEERDKRRQKQLEHQKAIMAQVEERRKKKQLEEEQRKWEEQEEEQRLAREKEQMQKQFEEEMLRQKQKEQLVTLKTNKLYETLQKSQELAQRLKQEQRIRDLAQKGHDISKLQKNLGSGDRKFDNCSTVISHQSHNFSDDVRCHTDEQASPRKDTAVQTDHFNTSAYHESAEKRIMCCGSPDISIEYRETSSSKHHDKESQSMHGNNISGKETGGIYSDLYEQYVRRERQIKPSEKYSKRPDWNINKPGKRYIPASERYPKQLQKQREENKVRRQMELLQLVERNTPRNLCSKKGGYSDRSPSPHEEPNRKNKGHRGRKEEQLRKNHLNEERCESPPDPAVKNRLHQVQQNQTHTSNFLMPNNSRGEKNTKTEKQQRSSPPAIPEAGRPPFSQFIPYIRTNEVYCLDPAAPVTRPSTHDPQYRPFNDPQQTPRQIFSSDHVRDPLLNPDVVKSRERQQAILKGLSELRQGLLQKQKELETALIPPIVQENLILPF